MAIRTASGPTLAADDLADDEGMDAPHAVQIANVAPVVLTATHLWMVGVGLVAIAVVGFMVGLVTREYISGDGRKSIDPASRQQL
jgi:hypothetical protein